ncbi:adenylate/guanylate cyclase domain-containing protein [Sphingomonas sp. NFX23]
MYIDIRRSTELSITHKPQAVAKLYSTFVRAMTKCARHFGGHVRGIIGDRVLVIFDCDGRRTEHPRSGFMALCRHKRPRLS